MAPAVADDRLVADSSSTPYKLEIQFDSLVELLRFQRARRARHSDIPSKLRICFLRIPSSAKVTGRRINFNPAPRRQD
ncbi:hypothetical protein NL676_009713 [Syzygium grande]|nr:hypothetical protein NL676_009713 [Syzygium grande]